MSNTYYWDLGFNLNAVQVNGTYYLQNGFVMTNQTLYLSNGQTKAVALPGTPVDLNEGDVINFNAYNVTNPAPVGIYSIANGSMITFQSAETNQEANSPFSAASIPYGPIPQPLGVGPSAIFCGYEASQPSPPNAPTYPSYGGPSLPVVNSGSFLMNVILLVQGPSGATMVFTTDPEMIVGGFG